MNFLRNHWFDVGGVLAVITGAWLLFSFNSLSAYGTVIWCSLIALFLHQLEEYRIIGTFPGMINSVIYASPQPDRFPLNPQTSLVINVAIGWVSYLLAALFAERAVWLGIATMLVSAGNVIAHTLFFNIRGKTVYNAGMASALLLFLPLVVGFFMILAEQKVATLTDVLGGFVLGIVMNVVGVLKLIDWMADRDTQYAFPARNLLRSGAERM